MHPNLYIVGAAKSGTTSLANILSQNQNIHVPKIKEPHFHIPEEIGTKLPYYLDSKDYLSLYEGFDDVKYRVDASVFYLPLFEFSIPSIKKIPQDNYIIILLRDPLERAISAYNYKSNLTNKEVMSFNDACRYEESRNLYNADPMSCYVWLSDYVESVTAFKENFDNVLVLTTGQLKDEGTLNHLLNKFLKDDFNYSTAQKSNRGIAWSNQFVKAILCSNLAIRTRRKLKEVSPRFHVIMKKIVSDVFLNNKSKNILIDEDVYDIFKQLKDESEKVLRIKY